MSVSSSQMPSSEAQLGTSDTTSRRDLTSWWKQFKRTTKKPEEKGEFAVSASQNRILTSTLELAVDQGIFGVPLHTSIRYANVAISLFDAQGTSFIYGYVPIVVAKCGVYLKEKGEQFRAFLPLANINVL